MKTIIWLIVILSWRFYAQTITFDNQGWNANQSVGTFTIDGLSFSSNQGIYTNYGYNKDINGVSIYCVSWAQGDYVNISVNRQITVKSIAAYQVGESGIDSLVIEGWAGSQKRYSQIFTNVNAWRILKLDYTAVNKIVLRSGNVGGKLLDYNLDNVSYSESTVPVELVSFNGVALRDNSVSLKWITATEVNMHGFEIKRKLGEGGPWESAGFVAAQGNSNKGKEYAFIDKLPTAGAITYRLKQIDNDGGFIYSESIVVSVLLKEFTVRNYPNPFNPETTIRYSLPYDCKVTLTIYNIIGVKIESPNEVLRTKGSYEIKWSGQRAGVYVLSMTTTRANGVQHTAAIKMILLK